MLNARPPYRRSLAARGQRGIVLILAMIVLVAMSLAAVALVRGVLTGNRVAANLAFQQSAMQSSEAGAETAIAWLEQKTRELVTVGNATRANKLFQNITASTGGETYNYVAHREDPDTTASQTWDDYWTNFLVPNGKVNTLPTDGAGNTVSFAIHRLCNGVGDPNSGIYCEASPSSNSSDCVTDDPLSCKSTRQVYYRITIRVAGARNAISFTQIVVAI